MRPVTSACALTVFQFWNCARRHVVDALDEGGLIDRRTARCASDCCDD